MNATSGFQVWRKFFNRARSNTRSTGVEGYLNAKKQGIVASTLFPCIWNGPQRFESLAMLVFKPPPHALFIQCGKFKAGAIGLPAVMALIGLVALVAYLWLR